MLPTRDPFLYTLSMTATEGTALPVLEEAALAELDRLARDGIAEQELQKAKNQLRARLVLENDSVTNLAHQLGYFDTVGSWELAASLPGRIEASTLAEVNAAAARFLRAGNRTVGWFEPVPAGSLDASAGRADRPGAAGERR
jgi:zinc protease